MSTKAESHTLKSEIEPDMERVFRCSCSLRFGSALDRSLEQIRAAHAAHVQDVLGPDREARP